MEEECGEPVGPFEDLEVIRRDAGMSTARFCELIEVPERTWRRWQARARADRPPKGPWPSRVAVRDVVVRHARAHPAWGHRKVGAMTRRDGHRVSQATVLRLLRDEGLILPAHYQRERRKLAERRKAAFATEPDGLNRVWQLDFSKYETITGGGVADRVMPGLRGQVRVRRARIPDREQARRRRRSSEGPRRGRTPPRPSPLVNDAIVNAETGEIAPVVTIEAVIAAHPELRHVRTRVRTPGQNGSRERGFGTMRYAWLLREEINHGLELVDQINAYRHDYNHVRPHEAIAWNRPADVHAGLANPRIPTFEIEESLPTT